MANDLTHNPLVLDTSATIYATGANRVKLRKARLTTTGTPAAVQSVIIQDGAGKEIAALSIPASGGADSIDFSDIVRSPVLDGLIVVMSPSPLTTTRLHLYCG
jgi:hypothetical protein